MRRGAGELGVELVARARGADRAARGRRRTLGARDPRARGADGPCGGEPLAERHVEDAARKRPLVLRPGRRRALRLHLGVDQVDARERRAGVELYYLAVMLEGGEDARFIARRMIVLASEDIGNADPQALLVAVAAAQARRARGPAGGAAQPRPGRRLPRPRAEVERRRTARSERRRPTSASTATCARRTRCARRALPRRAQARPRRGLRLPARRPGAASRSTASPTSSKGTRLLPRRPATARRRSGRVAPAEARRESAGRSHSADEARGSRRAGMIPHRTGSGRRGRDVARAQGPEVGAAGRARRSAVAREAVHREAHNGASTAARRASARGAGHRSESLGRSRRRALGDRRDALASRRASGQRSRLDGRTRLTRLRARRGVAGSADAPPVWSVVPRREQSRLPRVQAASRASAAEALVRPAQRIRAPRALAASSTASAPGLVLAVEDRVHLDELERVEQARLGDELEREVRLAVGEAAAHGRADARARTSGSTASRSRLTCTNAAPREELERLAHRALEPVAVDVAHREHLRASSRRRISFALLRRASGRRRARARARATASARRRSRTLSPATPSAAASGIPCTLPLGEVSGVLRSPCASIQSTPPAPCAARHPAERADRDRVVAAEHERDRAASHRVLDHARATARTSA